MPRVFRVLPRCGRPHASRGVSHVRASGGWGGHPARGGTDRVGSEDPALGVHQGGSPRGPSGQARVVPGARRRGVRIPRLRPDLRAIWGRHRRHHAARRGPARVRAFGPRVPREHRGADRRCRGERTPLRGRHRPRGVAVGPVTALSAHRLIRIACPGARRRDRGHARSARRPAMRDPSGGLRRPAPAGRRSPRRGGADATGPRPAMARRAGR